MRDGEMRVQMGWTDGTPKHVSLRSRVKSHLTQLQLTSLALPKTTRLGQLDPKEDKETTT